MDTNDSTLNSKFRYWFLPLILGLFAFFLLWNPVFAGLTIAIYAALPIIVIDIFQVLLSFRLRRRK